MTDLLFIRPLKLKHGERATRYLGTQGIGAFYSSDNEALNMYQRTEDPDDSYMIMQEAIEATREEP